MPATRIDAKNRYIAQVREQRRINKTPAESADSIKDYVDHVRTSQYAPIKRAVPPTSIHPLSTTLCPPTSTPRLLPGWHPPFVTPLPRIREMLGVLIRRGKDED